MSYLCVTVMLVLMADNYLEKRYEEYEAKKAAWLKGRSKYPRKTDGGAPHARLESLKIDPFF